MSARIDYDINASCSIAMTVSILIGGHPHPMPRSIIEKSLLHATRLLLQPFTSYTILQKGFYTPVPIMTKNSCRHPITSPINKIFRYVRMWCGDVVSRALKFRYLSTAAVGPA